MNRYLLNILVLLAVVLPGLSGCTQNSIPQKTVTQQETLILNDDFSKYRPKIDLVQNRVETVGEVIIQNEPIQSPYDLDDRLRAITDSMVARNDTIRLIDGYTILVYSGNNEIEAGRVRNRLFDIVPELETRFSYKLPTYFVKVGQFYQQIEAQPLYKKIRRYYPTSSIVPEKFASRP